MSSFDKANNHYNNKEYERAISMYKKSIEKNEYEAASFYNTGVCFIKLRNFEKAIPNIKKALKLKRESSYFFNLGYCYAMLNDKRKALNYFNTAWSLNQDDTECEEAINLILKSYQKENKSF